MDNITLYNREGASDKVYRISLHPKDHGFLVHFAFGRRGSTLNTGSKTPEPVEYSIAKGIFDKLIKEKTAKGYKAGPDSPAYIDTQRIPSGIQCQLLNPVLDHQLESLLRDRDHWMQEKFDGRRLLIKKEGNVITGINRLGMTVAVPEPIALEAAKYRGDFIIDGEAVGDTLHAFDLLAICGEDMREKRFAVRYFRLRDCLFSFHHPHILAVETYCGPEKAGWFSQFKADGKEGVVFKDIDAPYTPGRPNAGGTQLKHKFYETASFTVERLNEKRSVSLKLQGETGWSCAGNVTIPPNHDVPSPGSVVECRYLYAFRESGCIFQPVYLGRRDDIPLEECTINQLKYKAEPMLV